MDKDELARQLGILSGEIQPEANEELDEIMSILNASDDEILDISALSDKNDRENKEEMQFSGLSNEDLDVLMSDEPLTQDGQEDINLLNGDLDELLNYYEEPEVEEAIEEPKIEESIEEPKVEEATEEPNVEEITEEPQVEEVVEEPQVEEAIEEPEVEEVVEEPRIEEVAEEPKVEKATEEPNVEEITEEPQVEEVAEEPQVEEAIEEPKVEEVAEEPQVEEVAEEPKVEEATEEPKVEEVVEEPKVEEATEEPKVEEATEEPKVEEAIEEPKVEEVIEEPKVEEATEEPQIEEATEEPQVEEVTEEPKVEEVTEEPKVEEAIEEPQVEEATEEAKAEEVTEEPQIEEATEELQSVNELKQEDLEAILQEDEEQEKANELKQEDLEAILQEDEEQEKANELKQEDLEAILQEDEEQEKANELKQEDLEAILQEDEEQEKVNELKQEDLEAILQEDEEQKEVNELKQEDLEAIFQEDEEQEKANELKQEDLEAILQEDEEQEKTSELKQEEENQETEKSEQPQEKPVEEEPEVSMGMEEFMKFVEESKNRNSLRASDKNKKSMIIMLSVIAFLVTLIIITIIFFVISINKINKINTEKAIQKDNEIAQYVPQDENSIYLQIARTIDGQTIILEKVHFNLLETTFYFDTNINTRKFNITLTDSANTLYPMDIDFTKNGYDNNSTIIKFSALKEQFQNLILTFESIETGEQVHFDLDFDATIKPKTIKYINNQIVNKFNGFNVNINSAIFTDTTSKIDYTIEPDANTNYSLQQGSVDETDYIKLKQDNETIEPLGNKPVQTNLDRSIIGTMEFKTVPNQEGNIVLQFENIYKKYDINKTLSTDTINKGNIAYEFDNYKIFIEGIKQFGDKYVLVAHAEDSTISTENRPDDFNHVEVSLNAELVAKGSNGVELIIAPTQVRSASIGTDMIFELDEHQMNVLATQDVSVNLKSALIKLDPIDIPINLERCMTREVIGQEIMHQQIKDAFVSRLQYKIAGKSLSNVTGFSEDILNNEALMKEYAPMGKMSNPKCDVEFVSTKLTTNNLEAIVQEVYQYSTDEGIKVFYVKHKIKADYKDGDWTITYDEIIR